MFKKATMLAAFMLAAVSIFGSAQARAAATASIRGTVINESSGAPISGAKVTLVTGVGSQSAVTDAKGNFAFNVLAAGTYDLRATALQFNAYDTAPFPLADGQQFNLAVFLQPVSGAAITQLGHVVTVGHQTLNHSSAATTIIPASVFLNQGIAQVEAALDTTPGVTIEHFDNGAPGNVATLSIRGAGGIVGPNNNTGYEVLVLQDGQPMRSGQFGDFDVSTLTPDIYSSVEVVKGVGGTSLFGANTIGGTVNFVTRDPAATEGGEMQYGVGGFSTSDYNLMETDTFGKFGYLFDVHQYGTQGYIPNTFRADYGAFNPGDIGYVTNPTLAFRLRAGLGKVRYDFSKSTYGVLTVSDESDIRDQTGLLSNSSPVCFSNTTTCVNDPNGYPYFFGFPGNYTWNIQPKYGFDLHTAIGGGDLELRAYHQWLLRVVDGENAATPPATYNVGCCFIQTQADRLTGLSGTWTREFGNNTVVFGMGGNGDYYNFGSASNFAGKFIPSTAINFAAAPNGQATEIERTYLVRDDDELSPKFDLTVAGYYSDYDTLKVKRFDPRLAIVNKPSSNTVIRASIGSGFAAPRLSDLNPNLDTNLSDSGTAAGCPPSEQFCAASKGNPALNAETAVGEDVGWQRLFGNSSSVGVDLYRTDLKNHIFAGAFPAPPGLCFDPSPTPPTCPVGSTPILFIQEPVNIAGSVYQGAELNASIGVSNNFSIDPYYNIQSAYPSNVNVQTEVILGNVVNNQQYLDIPIHKEGWSIAYRNLVHASASFGGDYYAKNNSLNLPPFWVYNANYNTPIGDDMLHVAWSNIFNVNSGLFSTYNGGIPYPAAPGYAQSCFGHAGFYCTTAYNRAPHILSVTFDHRWGSLH